MCQISLPRLMVCGCHADSVLCFVLLLLLYGLGCVALLCLLDLLFAGGFDASVQYAGASGRWLVVNVQEPTEFSCALLNRDVWSHDDMRKLLQGPLLLVQLVAKSADGVRYKALYNARKEPHIAIIDPRTRQKMWSWSARYSTHA